MKKQIFIIFILCGQIVSAQNTLQISEKQIQELDLEMNGVEIPQKITDIRNWETDSNGIDIRFYSERLNKEAFLFPIFNVDIKLVNDSLFFLFENKEYGRLLVYDTVNELSDIIYLRSKEFQNKTRNNKFINMVSLFNMENVPLPHAFKRCREEFIVEQAKYIFKNKSYHFFTINAFPQHLFYIKDGNIFTNSGNGADYINFKQFIQSFKKEELEQRIKKAKNCFCENSKDRLIAFGNILGHFVDSSGNFLHLKGFDVEFKFHNIIGAGKYHPSVNKREITIEPDPKYRGQTTSTYEFFPDTTFEKGEYLFLISKENAKDSTSKATVSYSIEGNPNKQSFDVEKIGKSRYNIQEMPLDSIIHINTLSSHNPLKIKLQNLTGGTFKIMLKEGNLLYIDDFFSSKDKLKLKYKWIDGKDKYDRRLHLTCPFIKKINKRTNRSFVFFEYFPYY